MSMADKVELEGGKFEVVRSSGRIKVVLKINDYRSFYYVDTEFNTVEKAKIELAQRFLIDEDIAHNRKYWIS